MMKKYEEPKLNLIRFEMEEKVTSNQDFTLSQTGDFGEGVEDW